MLKSVKAIAKSVLANRGYKAVPLNAVLMPRLSPSGKSVHVKGDCLITGHVPKYLSDGEFAKALDDIIRNEAFQGEPDSYPIWRLHVVWNAVRACRHIAGDVVEFGTFRGGNAYIMLRSLETASCRKRLFLYDTFTGIPDVELTDEERARGFVGRYADTSVERVRKLLQPYQGQVEFQTGLIPESLACGGPEEISFIHMDLNSAAPTRHALEWLFPRWQSGGICVLDDYLWEGYEEQRVVVDQFFGARALAIIPIPTGQGLVIKA